MFKERPFISMVKYDAGKLDKHLLYFVLEFRMRPLQYVTISLSLMAIVVPVIDLDKTIFKSQTDG